MDFKIDHRYTRIKELGSGFSGEVLLVQDDEGEKALKFLKTVQYNVAPAEALQNFKNEFSLLTELNHPGIARIIDFGYDTFLRKYYFTSELVRGTDFFKATEGKSLEQIEDLAVQVLRALNYLHSRGIYHLDIKPQNILVQEKDGKLEAKIIDFGLSHLKNTQKMVGTPAYMAPEIILSEKPDGRADLYSFGVLLYKVLTRVNPFASKNLKETIEWQKTKQPDAPTKLNETLPSFWDRILLRLLEKKPALRYPQASFVIRDINFLANKNYEIETLDTRRSYLLDKGRLIARDNETATFKKLFESIFKSENRSASNLLIIEGATGTGKTRLLSEFKYHAQLEGIPVVPFEKRSELPTEAPYMLVVDDNPQVLGDEINRLVQEAAYQKVMILWATSQTIPGWRQAEKITLTNFTEADVKAYLSEVTGLTDSPPRLVREIYRRTEGNPQFVTELFRSLMEQGLILDSSGRWAHGTFEDININFEQIAIPKNIDELLRSRYLTLSNEEKEVADWIAVSDTPLPVSQLLTLAQTAHPQKQLLSLMRLNLIEKAETDGYTFINPLLAETILEVIPQSRQRKMHDSLALHLQNISAPIEEILKHRGEGVEDKKAIEALLELGETLLQKEQTSDALRILNRAWERSKILDIFSQVETELALAEGLIRGREYKKAIKHFRHLKEMFELHPDLAASHQQKIELCEKMGDLHVKLDTFEEALNFFSEALTLLEQNSENPVRKMVIENHIANVYRLQGKIDEAETIYLKNTELWDEFSEEQKRQVTNNRLADTLVLKNEFDMALRQTEKDISFFELIGDTYLTARAIYLRGDIHYRLLLGYFGARRQKEEVEATQSFEKCVTLAKTIEAHDLLLRSYNGLGNLAWERQDYLRTADYYQRALALARKLEDLKTAATLSLNLGNLFKTQKQYHDAYSHLVYAINTLEAMENKNAWNWVHLFQSYVELAEVHRELGDLEKAEEVINRAGGLVRTNPHLQHYEFSISFEKSRLHYRRGRMDLCKEYLKKAKTLAHEGEQMNELARFEDSVRYDLQKWEASRGQPENRIEAPITQPEVVEPSVESKDQTKKEETLAFETILKINTLINSEHNPDHLLKMVLNYALELTCAESGVVLLIGEQNELTIKASVNNETEQEKATISLAVANQAIESGEPVMVDNALTDGRFDHSDSIVMHSLKSILCLPIRSKNRIIGVFYLDNRMQTNTFQGINLKLLRAFCEQVGIALENAKLINSYRLVKDQLEKKLEQTTEELSEVREILKTEAQTFHTKYTYSQIISRSQPMREIFKILDKITETNLSVYIQGASGTGKELIARALHYNNPTRAEKRFMAINCAAIPANLIESELFGYKAGSFTGAQKDKKGIFEEANGGTLFLDEIADLDLNLQVKLLRVLQEGEVNRIGDVRPIKVDVRIINASHKDIEEMVRKGTFREDLYFRLCQIKVALPPLSSRKEDIPLLVDHFIEKYRRENRVETPIHAGTSFLKGLLQYNWPGNIRELENLISVACALRQSNELTLSSLPPNYNIVSELKKNPNSFNVIEGGKTQNDKGYPIDEHNMYDPRKTWNQYEVLIIAKAYVMNDYRKVATADMLGISHSTLYKKIGENNLDEKDHPLYKDPFVYIKDKQLKDYIPETFLASLHYHDEHPYAAIKTLGVSQGYFYKILKIAKTLEAKQA